MRRSRNELPWQNVMLCEWASSRADGLARFLRLNRAGSGDYTRDRHKWLSGTTIQEIMTDLESHRDPAA